MLAITRPTAALAIVRVLAMPLFLLAERAVDHPAARGGPFEELLAVATLYALVAAALELRGRSIAPPLVQADAKVGQSRPTRLRRCR